MIPATHFSSLSVYLVLWKVCKNTFVTTVIRGFELYVMVCGAKIYIFVEIRKDFGHFFHFSRIFLDFLRNYL